MLEDAKKLLAESTGETIVVPKWMLEQLIKRCNYIYEQIDGAHQQATVKLLMERAANLKEEIKLLEMNPRRVAEDRLTRAVEVLRQDNKVLSDKLTQTENKLGDMMSLRNQMSVSRKNDRRIKNLQPLLVSLLAGLNRLHELEHPPVFDEGGD